MQNFYPAKDKQPCSQNSNKKFRLFQKSCFNDFQKKTVENR